MLLTKYGYREWMLITSLCGLAGAFALVLLWPVNDVLAVAVTAAILLTWMALVSFFRDPFRRLPRTLEWGDMLSPADGVISAVETVNWHDATEGPAVIVRIFLSVLNVHVNRSPFDAEVLGMEYRPGRFLNAQTEESARVNESNLITMRIETGETIGVRQVSGMLARRIVCPLRPGDRLRRGQKFGMIKFGSTTELILPRPQEVTVHVARGDRVRGGITILATIVKPRG